MRIGVPLSSVNCFEGWVFFSLASLATETGAIRVPNPAAGMITNTFIAGCQYTSAKVRSSNSVVNSDARLTVTRPNSNFHFQDAYMPGLLSIGPLAIGAA